ncbi:MAG: TRAP transporter small permease [Paracoccaceae bacterium]
MKALTGLLGPLVAVNTLLLRAGRAVAWVFLGLMVVIILAQIFFRYVIGDALNWTEEAARFLMLWMCGLIAPSAYRWGGFVSIDMFVRALPARVGAALGLALLAVALSVLTSGIYYGWDHVTGFAGRFNSSTLRLPLDWVGGKAVKVRLAYMHASLFTCMILMFLVNVEMMLKTAVSLFDPTVLHARDPDMIVAESD